MAFGAKHNKKIYLPLRGACYLYPRFANFLRNFRNLFLKNPRVSVSKLIISISTLLCVQVPTGGIAAWTFEISH